MNMCLTCEIDFSQKVEQGFPVDWFHLVTKALKVGSTHFCMHCPGILKKKNAKIQLQCNCGKPSEVVWSNPRPNHMCRKDVAIQSTNI